MDERELLILSLEPIVRAAMRHFTGYDVHTREDLVSEAWLGAIAAVDNYRPDRGASLRTYAAHRIHGAILDFLDRQRTISRKALSVGPDDPRRKAPSSLEVLAAAEDNNRRWEPAAHDDPAKTACDHVDAVRYVGELPKRDQQIVLERAFLQTTLAELAHEHEITESRACQIVGRDMRAYEHVCQNAKCGKTFTVMGPTAKPKLCRDCRRRIHKRKPRPNSGGADERQAG